MTLLAIGLALAKGPKGPGGDGPDGPDGSPGRPKGDGDGGDGTPAKKYGDVDASKSVSDAQAAVEGKVAAGKPKDSDGDGEADLPGTTHMRLTPSNPPDPNATPRGTPTEVRGNTAKKRALEAENRAADTLAKQGYDVEQNPPPKSNGREPDYKIEGEYADCYAPAEETSVDNVRTKISDKVKKGQADRIVLDMDAAVTATPESIRALLDRRPISGLKEIKIVRHGQVIDFYP
ncbi:hypothetical protein Afil01_68580 [Actinorhabdospora filicis]|uniref:tRNA nuclease CdiA C-terminal domain-containing protein n=1 Tax=Actinorhabdospora filicis TaxID=1785913 RepID=A0A9W6ST63_9ACTN|nr:hypothetical protein [Actinorhabdospora filicis]GLZ82051.1 hypothetical protein Afil01_68580 [Actinorhabdospora filicis]